MPAHHTSTPPEELAGPIAFFQAQHKAFRETVGGHRQKADLIDRIWMQAFSSYEHNVREQTASLPVLACHKGCGTCCQIQVLATAPEVFMVARYIRNMQEGFRRIGIDLAQRLAEAPARGRTADPNALLHECPFLVEGICVIYPVRPLACRGHASFDKEACIAALQGAADEVPVSAPHRTVRSLVQNALQSALRDEGFAWDLHDVAEGLRITLARPDTEAAWVAGGDVLASARVEAMARDEVTAAFDQLKA